MIGYAPSKRVENEEKILNKLIIYFCYFDIYHIYMRFRCYKLLCMGTLIIYLTDFSRAKVKSVNCGFCLMLFSVQFTLEYEFYFFTFYAL